VGGARKRGGKKKKQTTTREREAKKRQGDCCRGTSFFLVCKRADSVTGRSRRNKEGAESADQDCGKVRIPAREVGLERYQEKKKIRKDGKVGRTAGENSAPQIHFRLRACPGDRAEGAKESARGQERGGGGGKGGR